MTPLALLHDHGLTVRPLDGGKLYVSPRDRLTDDLRYYIKEHKAEILAALQPRWTPELASQGYVWCLDCIHWQSIETQQAMLWKYADQPNACTHESNPYRGQNPCTPRKCKLFQTRHDA